MKFYETPIAAALSHILETPIHPEQLEIPPDRALGDFAFPCFTLAKTLRKAPPVIAKELAATVRSKISDEFQVQAVGPYVNFTITPENKISTLLGAALDGSLGQAKPRSQTWLFEYSSPNVAKHFNIYHIRTTIQGAALARIAAFRGYKTVRMNHLGDWGTQYGKLAVALSRYKSDLPEHPTVDDLVSIYVRFHEDAKTHPELEDEAREAFRRLESGDREIRKIWQYCVDISLQEFQKIYERIGVDFDFYWGESFYEHQIRPLLQSLKDQKILNQDQGAWIVPAHDRAGHELPPSILEKADGSSIYATRDLAAALYRYEQFHFNKMTYVVGAEQKMHFEQLFSVLRTIKAPFEPHCEHLATGLYRFKGAKMSTRKGNFITLTSVLDAARHEVRELLKARPNAALFSNELIDQIAEQVGVGAVLFHDLKSDPARDIDFDLDQVIDFQGETGPYVQYAHARMASILRKAQDTGLTPADVPTLSKVPKLEPAELALINHLMNFERALDRSLENLKASQLAHYLLDLVGAFHSFYRDCHVMGESVPTDTSRFRLGLVFATQKHLQICLTLLGIPAPERM